MKRIRLLKLPDPRFSNPSMPEYEPNLVDYRVVVEQCVRVPMDRQAGASIDEMRKGIRILDALDACDPTKEPTQLGFADVLVLEDADWEFLKQKVEKMPWAQVDRRFLKFHDDVVNATDAIDDAVRINGVAARM